MMDLDHFLVVLLEPLKSRNPKPSVEFLLCKLTNVACSNPVFLQFTAVE